MFRIKYLIMLIFTLISFCSSPDTRERIIINTGNNNSPYEKYLVSSGEYTTKGSEFHDKYLQYLLGIARIIVEEKKIPVIDKSIGFYYDKREERKDKLYLGIDISAQIDSTLYYSTYQGVALAQFRKYLKDIIDVFLAGRKIFTEKEIVGSVISIRWERDKAVEMVSIWIDQNDAVKYEEDKITFDELIQRNFITNTEGKIIKLLL